MPLVNGVGYGDNSADKQNDFRSLLSLHVDVVNRITSKPNRAWTRFYSYVDMNAGPGIYNGLTGSPIIFLNSIERTSIPYRGFFIERESINAASLEAIVCNRQLRGSVAVVNNDHAIALRSNLLTGRPTYGLVYHDPSGSIPDFDLLAQISRCQAFKYMEFMVYLSATNIKRVRRMEEEKDGGAKVKLLTTYLQGINKSTWIIRKPQGKHQWTFVLGSNWKRFPEWESRGFYRIDSPQGQGILKNLTYTGEELDAMSGQLNFFDQPGPETNHTVTMGNI